MVFTHGVSGASPQVTIFLTIPVLSHGLLPLHITWKICLKFRITYSEKIVGKERARIKHTNLNMMIELLEY